LIKRKQKLGSSSSSICKHKSLNRCGSHIQYRVYYKDAHIRLLGLFSVFFYSLQRKKQKKGGVLVKYLFIPTRREGDRRLLRKVLFYFRVRQFSAPTVTEPLPRDLYSFFSSYILSTSLISFPQILAV